MNALEQLVNYFCSPPGWDVRVIFGALGVFGVYVGKKVVPRLTAAVKACDEVPEDHQFRPVTEAWQALFGMLLLTILLMITAIILLQIGVNNPVMWAIVDTSCLISLLMPCHLYRIYERCRQSAPQHTCTAECSTNQPAKTNDDSN